MARTTALAIEISEQWTVVRFCTSEYISGLMALGDYDDDSEGDEQAPQNDLAEGDALEDAKLEDLSDDDAEEEIDPAMLLELIRAARGGQEPWAADEEAVDWGDMDEGDVE